jgi:hypothetical protein
MNRIEFDLRHLDIVEERKLNNLCPECAVSWQVLNDCLANDGSAREEAILIITNCDTCTAHFDYLLPAYSRIDVEPIKGSVEKAKATAKS